jgi:hypothetical protein
MRCAGLQQARPEHMPDQAALLDLLLPQERTPPAAKTAAFCETT